MESISVFDMLSIGVGVGLFNYHIDPYGYFSSDEKYIKTLTRIAKPEILNIGASSMT